MNTWWRWISLSIGCRGRGEARISAEARVQNCGNSLNALWLSISPPRLQPRSQPCCNTASTSKPPAPPCWSSSAWVQSTHRSHFLCLRWKTICCAVCQVSPQECLKLKCKLVHQSSIQLFLIFTEFCAENLGDFFIFLRRFADEVLESSAESLEHVLTFITVFMGNVERCEPLWCWVLRAFSPVPCGSLFTRNYLPTEWRILICGQSWQRFWRLWCPIWSLRHPALPSLSCSSAKGCSAHIDTLLSLPKPSLLFLWT